LRRAAGAVLALGVWGLGCAAAPAYRAAASSSRSAPPSTTPSTRSTSLDSPEGAFAQPPPSASRPAQVERPAPRFDVDREPPSAQPVQPPPPPGATGSATTQSLGESTVVSAQGGGVDEGERAVREARIGAQVQRIREEQIRLATNPGVCHDVCFAAGSICLAAQEVCRLTGDADARCERARGACADAGRQRDGSCPVCPPTH
jgi:hypothetical protein